MTENLSATSTNLERPYIDQDQQRTVPVQHRYIHGGFAGGATRFSFYLPPAAKYEGRFFHYITPVPLSENLSQGDKGEEDKISFAVESGAILVESNSGGPAAADPSYGAFRANAAVAAFARQFAQDAYGPHTTYGYAFGGSGGAFRTIAGAENTSGVWDGFVPYVIGSPMSLPNVFTARLHGARVLRSRLDDIVDALEPGGSGDPFTGLDGEQAAALREVTRLGFPLRSWFAHRTMGMHAFAVIYPVLRMIDPTYFEDFWKLDGYLGADPESSIHRDRVVFDTQVAELLSPADLTALGLDTGPHPGESNGRADDGWLGDAATNKPIPVAIRLSDTPSRNPFESELILGGELTGERLVVLGLRGNIAVLGPADEEMLRRIRIGSEVTLDNSGFLAAQTYHRHQLPGPDFAVWDQFRDNDGQPMYPQRPTLVGPILALGATGTVQTGRWNGRMIIVESLLDREAFPWQADWYRRLVTEHLGPETDQHLRVWMVDNALHGDFTEQEYPGHTVSYLGALHEALRQLAAWVERGEQPAPTSTYTVEHGQISIPAAAPQRGGVQPVLTLRTTDGGEQAGIASGELIELVVRAATPGTGQIVAFEWDIDGSGQFESAPVTPATQSTQTRALTFSSPGIFFPAVRVVARQNPSQTSTFARIQNVARVRIVVSEK